MTEAVVMFRLRIYILSKFRKVILGASHNLQDVLVII